MRFSYIYLLFMALFCQLAPNYASAAGITNYPKLNTPEFWQALSPKGDTLIMNDSQTRAFNQKISKESASVYDLAVFPSTLSSDQLHAWLTPSAALLNNSSLYANGVCITARDKQTLLDERNLAGITAKQDISYAVTLRRTNLRALPSTTGLFESNGDTNFDVLQETAVDPAEPLILLHKSKSGAFSYVQMRNYRGWLRTEDVAALSYNHWRNYNEPKQFLIVTAPKFSLYSNGEERIYQMGAKLPLLSINGDGYLVRVPLKTGDGMFAEQTATIKPSDSLHLGYLPYTPNTIIEQSFKFLNEPYGWGGLKNSVDCSSFIADIYRTVGIELPRNADEQEESAGEAKRLAGLSLDAKKQAVLNLNPGDALFFPGHTMLYLGKTNDTPFIIHALGSHTNHYADGQREKIRTMKVVVSDLSLRRYGGETFLQALTSAKTHH